MVDTAFTNSYIATDTELETLIGNDKRASAIALKAASAADQGWYCQQATEHIDSMPLRGRKYDTDIIAGVPVQALEFPRIIDRITLDWNDLADLAIVPALVKKACLEEAIAIFSQGTGGRKDLQEQGVKSFSIGGKLQETFIDGAGSSGLQSATAKRLLRRYTGAEIR